MNKLTLLLISIASLLSACDQQTAATEKLDEKSIKVGIMALKWPKTVAINTDFIVNARIINTGEVTIPALGKDANLLKVGVTYHWKSMEDTVIVWDGVVTSLKSDLKKGEEQKVDIAVKSLPAPGKYILEIDLVQNSAFWFAGAGSQTARMSLDVK